MKLPNTDKAFIDDKKLLDYCLNPLHEEGKHKARVFQSALGIGEKQVNVLKKAIFKAILTENAVLTNRTTYGNLYQVDFKMVYLRKSAFVRTAWIIKFNEDFPRLITCFVIT